MSKKQKRECQPCTGCCDGWVQMVIGDDPVYPGQPCPHSTGSGCDDYLNRPTDPCDTFFCGWVMKDSPLPEWMKPSNSKTIVLFNKFQWQGVPVDLAVPAGKRIPPRALNWLLKFAKENGRPLVYSEQIIENGIMQKEQLLTAYGPTEFQQQVVAWQESGVKLW